MLKRAALLELTAGAAMGIYDRSELGKILDDVERIDPNSITALSIRATLAMREGTLDEAAQRVEQLAHIDNNNPTVWLPRATLSHVRDESEQALSAGSCVYRRGQRSARDRRITTCGTTATC